MPGLFKVGEKRKLGEKKGLRIERERERKRRELRGAEENKDTHRRYQGSTTLGIEGEREEMQTNPRGRRPESGVGLKRISWDLI